MAQHHQQPPNQQLPKAEVELVYSTDKGFNSAASFNEMSRHLLKEVEERIPSHETHQNKLKELENLMQSIINNHADVKQELQQVLKTKQKHLEDFGELKKIVSTMQEHLEKHEKATLENTTAMLGHTEGIRNLITGLTTRVEKLEGPETPPISTVVESQQNRTGKQDGEIKKLAEKFENLVQNNANYQRGLNQKQETLDAKFVQEQGAKDAALRNMHQQLKTANDIIAQQNTKIDDQDKAIEDVWRGVRLYMTANVAVLCATIWFWWQSHKA